MKRVAAILFLVVSIALWLAPSGSQAQPLTHELSGIVLPEDIAGFRRTSHADYESKQPGLGAGYNYNNGKGAVATIYIYTAGQSKIPSEIDSPLVARLREQTMREITEFAKSRGETTVHRGNQLLHLTHRGADIAALFDRFVIAGPSGERDTMLWLWAARGHFLKIRVTRLPNGELPAAQIDAFFEFVARAAAD